MHKSLFLTLLMTAIGFSVSSNTYASSQLYRYINDNGVQVITDVISPEDAARGYDIIDSRGRLIKNIPPEMSEAEKKRLQNARAEKERLEQWDKELSARYSTVEDIEAAKERRMSGIRNNISSLELTLQNITQTIRHFQAEAAASERQGDQIAEETLSSIGRLQNDKIFIEQEIQRQKKRQVKTNNEYDADIARFKLISAKK